MRRSRSVHDRRPWDLVELELHELSAIKAIATQHPAGFAVIVEKICGVDLMSYAAGGVEGQRATDFAEGKRWVGNTLRAIMRMKMPSPKQRQSGPDEQTLGPPPGD